MLIDRREFLKRGGFVTMGSRVPGLAHAAIMPGARSQPMIRGTADYTLRMYMSRSEWP
jgi:hypothetical protein